MPAKARREDRTARPRSQARPRPRQGRRADHLVVHVQDQGLSAQGLLRAVTMTEDRHVRRLMLFFATVYVVEGIGQGRVGIVYQPVNYYLKEIGWTPLEVTAYLA